MVENNLKKVHKQKNWLFSALNSEDMGKLLHTKLSYLVLVPEVRNTLNKRG